MSSGSDSLPPLAYSPALESRLKLAIVLVVTLITSMEFLTSYAVGVALPDIQGDLAASFDEGSWIITVYTICFLIGLVLSNWSAERFGYRRHLARAIMLFATSSVCCGLSHTLPEILLFRGFMGFAGGTFLVRAQTAINLTHSGESRIKATVFFALVVVGFARTFGAAVGGYLCEWYSWRSIFFLNLPFAIAALALMFAFFPDVVVDRKKSRLDFFGLTLLIGCVVSIQLVLSRGERDDWFNDPMIVMYTLLAVICAPTFIWWSCRPANKSPILDLRVYRHRNFVIGSIYVVILGLMLYGQLYVVPQFLRGIQHYSAWRTGQMQTVNAVAFFVGLLGGAMLMKRVGLKVALTLGALTFTVGMGIWATRLSPGISAEAMLLPLACTGFGAGWQIGPLSALINSQTPPALLGTGMELYLFQRQLGGSWGIAILAILIDSRRTFWSGRMSERITPYSLVLQDTLHQSAAALHFAGLPTNQAAAAAVGIIHGRLLIQSVVNAYVDTYWYQVGIGFVALLTIYLFARGRAIAVALRHFVAMVR